MENKAKIHIYTEEEQRLLAKYEINLYKSHSKRKPKIKRTKINCIVFENNPEIAESIIKMNSYIKQLQRENRKQKRTIEILQNKLKTEDEKLKTEDEKLKEKIQKLKNKFKYH